MIPSGEVYDHDCVRWYKAHDIQRSIDRYHNIGDAFVYDSSLKLLDFDALDVLEIREVSQKDIDRCNAEFDYCFLRGSNYVHNEMDWEKAPEVLERIKIPLIAFGVGFVVHWLFIVAAVLALAAGSVAVAIAAIELILRDCPCFFQAPGRFVFRRSRKNC